MKAIIEGVEQVNPSGFGGMVSRSVALERGKKFDFEKGIETIATTEAPALVVDWERWQVVREVLPMRYMEAPTNDKVPLLDSHERFSIEMIKGTAKNFRVQGGQLLCDCFVSDSEPIVRQKISEGHIDSVSIGYETDSAQTVEVPKKKSISVDGIQYKNDFEDEYPLLVRTWWKTHELSLVPIGADDAAKFKSMSAASKNLIEKLSELSRKVDELTKQGVKKEQILEAANEVELFKLRHAHNMIQLTF